MIPTTTTMIVRTIGKKKTTRTVDSRGKVSYCDSNNGALELIVKRRFWQVITTHFSRKLNSRKRWSCPSSGEATNISR